MNDITIRQSKIKIVSRAAGIFFIAAFLSSAVSYSGIGLESVALFAERFVRFSIFQAPFYALLLILILSYERQFVEISANGVCVRIRAGKIRQIPFESVVDVRNTRLGLVIVVRGEPSIRIDSWRYKKSALEQVRSLLRERCKDAHKAEKHENRGQEKEAVRPGKVTTSGGWESRCGKADQPPGREPWTGGSNPKS